MASTSLGVVTAYGAAKQAGYEGTYEQFCQQMAEAPKPVGVRLAEMRDFEGDGFADELYMLFEKKLRPKDML